MASGRQLGSNGSASSRQKRFSIDDAFEEETDEAIKVYGATTTMSPVGSVVGVGSGGLGIIDGSNGRGDNPRNYRLVNDGSRDSDSLIQDFYDGSNQDPALSRSCFRHPKVRENWRMVLAATTLLVIGLGLLATGILALAEPQAGLQGAVFLIAGFICFVPGAYHVVYIYLAAKGRRGYHFHNLPLFT